MSELRRHGRELLEASKRERTPSPQHKQRLIRQLLESAAQASRAAQEPAPLDQRLGWREKVLLLSALSLAIGGAIWLVSR